MICKNCKAEYDDNAAQCPECGMENEAVTERFDELEEPAEASVEEAEEASQPIAENAESDSAEVEENEEASCEESAEKSEAESTAEEKPVADRAVKTKKLKRSKIKATKQEKKITTVIIVLMCLVGLCAGVTAYLNITTDIFSVDTSSDKVIAVGFAPQEEKQLEDLLAKCYSVAKSDFGGESTCTESLLAKINPADKGNVYSKINSVAEKLKTEPDPADRFADENGEYAYYKLSQEKIDTVLKSFGLESYRGESGKNYYYYDGYYYFNSAADETRSVNAEVTKSGRILDGSYYAEFYYYIESKGKIKKSKTRYLLVEANKDEATGETCFEIKKVSSKPVITAAGKLADTAKSYERKTEIIEGRTKDGILFSRYVIDYPVLDGDDAGVKNVNDFLKNTVSVYQMKAESVDEIGRAHV